MFRCLMATIVYPLSMLCYLNLKSTDYEAQRLSRLHFSYTISDFSTIAMFVILNLLTKFHLPPVGTSTIHFSTRTSEN
jgi:hypothetical protein